MKNNISKCILSVPILLTLVLSLTNFVQAQWATDPAINNQVSTAVDSQKNARSISDGNGGVIVVWEDRRSGFLDIYAQRINATGVAQWTANGIAICTAGDEQLNPSIVPDGSGGAIITWQDFRSLLFYDIYAQRVNASGVAQWATDGVVVSTATNDQRNPIIVPVSTGGAIVAWEDFRSGTNFDIYAQYINASGSSVWTANGRSVTSAPNSQLFPRVVMVGTVEPIFTWEDARGTSTDIYAQKLNVSGIGQWTTDGVVVCSATASQTKPAITSDGSAGAIITWADDRSGPNDIFAQRINSSGVPQWTANGVVICSATSNQFNPSIIPSTSGSAIIAWEDFRNGTNFDLYSQRVNSSGVVQWAADGVVLCTSAGDQTNLEMIADGSNGAILVWEDMRGSNRDLYGQRLNVSGVVQWATNGVAIATATNSQSNPDIVPDDSSFGQGVFIAWTDSRTGNLQSNLDVYAQRVNLNGFLCGNVSVPGTISGSQTILAGSSNSYNVVAVLGATSYTWMLPSGWTGTSTTNSISTTASGTSGNITVSTSNACGGSFGSAILAITVNKQNQTITFNSLTPKAMGEPAFNLTATSSSTLPVSFASSNTAVATVSGGTVTLVGVGTTTIIASQSGNDIFNVAPNVLRDLVVNKGNQTITFGTLPSKTLGDAPFALTATSSSGLSLVYSSSNTSLATVSGNSVTLVAAGSVTIQANQAGNANFNAATTVSQTFCINPVKPTITASLLNTETPTLTSSSSIGNQWFLNNTAISGAINATFGANAAGIYKVQVTAGVCLSAFSDDFSLVITSEEPSKFHSELSVYPNPSFDRLTVTLPETTEKKLVSIYTLNGQRTDSRETYSNELQFDVAGYASGIYLVKVLSGQVNQVVRFTKR
jgi:hypothetical protein